jgi:non-specific serine/threonine protein kinase
LSGEINHGDSGVPVINMDENVIGITNAKDLMKDGHAQAITISLLVDLLKKKGINPFKNGGTEPKTPDNLPVVNDNFTGRDDDVKRVLEQLSHHHIVTITGLGGIGKSELAKVVAHAAGGEEWAADGMQYIDLQAMTDASAVMTALVAGLGLHRPANIVALAQQLSGRRLYVHDDLYQALVNDGEGVWTVVEALYQYAKPAHFLLTCREWVGEPAETNLLPLDKLLSPHDAILFRKLADACHYKWHEGDEERLKALLRERDGLDGYPLAINIAANLLNPMLNLSLQEVLEQWEDCRTASIQLPDTP